MEEEILTPEQISENGVKIYQDKLKSILEPTQIGKFVAIEVVSGEYFIGETILEAIQKGKEKYPNRLLHTIKIGYEGIFKMGSYSKNAVSLYGRKH